MSLEVELITENAEEVKAAFERFGPALESSLFQAYERAAMSEEKNLKATIGFSDRTGRLRRSLYVVAVRYPLGLEFGSHLGYAVYVAMGHGTWLGGWWVQYLSEAVPRVLEAINSALERLTRKFSQEGEV
jgi:hypothetical protein